MNLLVAVILTEFADSMADDEDGQRSPHARVADEMQRPEVDSSPEASQAATHVGHGGASSGLREGSLRSLMVANPIT